MPLYPVEKTFGVLALVRCSRERMLISLNNRSGFTFMRMRSIRINGIDGFGQVHVDNLSDTVVLAGPNGVGKTRVMRQLIKFFRDPQASPHFQLVVEATSQAERQHFGKRTISTDQQHDAELLRTLLQRNQRRNKYQSTVLNFDSDRAISKIAPFPFSWDMSSPHDEDVGWDLSYGFLRDRFADVQHSLFRLVESQRRKISEDAVDSMRRGNASLPLNYSDPLIPYRDAFSRLLAPKRLLDIDVRSQQIKYEQGGAPFPLASLSSGEREVINIVFDFILRNPSDCIVLFDEPELHLHPELSYKLLQTLTGIGKNNQFIFCTHSPEIITASIENSVVFLTPKSADNRNQAIVVTRDDETHNALNLLGQSIGIISLGKKLLLIEGDESSLDKQTYGAILKNEIPEIILVPVGGKGGMRSFEEVRKSILNKTIWGVEFFMLCDRDAVYENGLKSAESMAMDRVAILPRYHLENYFLDAAVLASVFSEMDQEESWLRDRDEIRSRINVFARQAIPLAVALKVAASVREGVGNVDIMVKGVNQTTTLEELSSKLKERIETESARVSIHLDKDAVCLVAREEYERLIGLAATGADNWHNDIPGRVVFNRFASASGMKAGRLKTLYLRHAAGFTPEPFAEIRAIFARYRSVSRM